MPNQLFLKFFITSNLGSMLFRFTSFSSLCVILFSYSCCLIYATSVTRIQVTAYPSVRNKLSTYERLLPAFGTDEQICTFVFFNSVLTQFNCQCFWRCHIVIAMTIALEIVYRLRQISSAFWRTDLSPASSEKLRGKSALNGPPEDILRVIDTWKRREPYYRAVDFSLRRWITSKILVTSSNSSFHFNVNQYVSGYAEVNCHLHFFYYSSNLYRRLPRINMK
jgi:hypothetical protein